MEGVIDNLVFFFALVYYVFLVIVYLVRAHNLSDLQLKMAPIFSIQLVARARMLGWRRTIRTSRQD